MTMAVELRTSEELEDSRVIGHRRGYHVRVLPVQRQWALKGLLLRKVRKTMRGLSTFEKWPL